MFVCQITTDTISTSRSRFEQLEPGDRILEVNHEDVQEAPRDHVIQLVRACEAQVSLLVCQPLMNGCAGRKSTLLSATKKAKLRSRPTRVRFAESVCVNGAPLFPVSHTSNCLNLNDLVAYVASLADKSRRASFMHSARATGCQYYITYTHTYMKYIFSYILQCARATC